MSETTHLGLPLVQPAQAQKHVTVNEALAKLDGLTQLILSSVTILTPPTSASDGQSYFVPASATGDWAAQAGNVAVYSNGGWVFSTPSVGWLGFIEDEGVSAVFDGVAWARAALSVSPNGAALACQVYEFDHVLTSGATSVTVEEIPKNAIVLAVTGRVKTAITGTASSFDIGVSGATNRYGGGIGFAQGSWFIGATGQPVTYYADTPIELTASGGDFASGEIRLAIHYFIPSVPRI